MPAPLGIYVHVPFCTTRCGYCDFNTYTAAELPGGGDRASFPDAVLAELDVALEVVGPGRPVSTVFFGGGTPTLLAAAELGRIVSGIGERFGLAPGAEVTTEANPDSVDAAGFEALRAGGFTRVSLGMQSSAPHVLATLDRTHTPGRAVAAAAEARASGFEHVSLDLIYGTPGETDDDWRRSLDDALSAGPDHVSAYGLIVEPGTRFAAQVRRGDVPVPDDDAMAARYEIADAVLGDAGFSWYEVSNWALAGDARCRHNLGYWTGADWWGAGPGAHSHVAGRRWWNAKHPSAWAAALREGRPAEAGIPTARAEALRAGGETLEPATQRFERIMLELRLSDGLDASVLAPAGRAAADRHAALGHLDPEALAAGRAVLTLRGRLLSDAVIRDLTD